MKDDEEEKDEDEEEEEDFISTPSGAETMVQDDVTKANLSGAN